MKIGLISDTHIPTAAPSLTIQVRHVFHGVDLILHAGDIYDVKTLDWLQTIAPVLAARGNGDRSIRDSRVMDSHVLLAQGIRIGLSHGLGLPPDPWRPLSKIMDREFGERVDVFVYGDTHVATIEVCDGVLLVNPGSPTLPHNLLGKLGTLGILEIHGDQVRVRILSLATDLSGIDVPEEFTHVLIQQ